MLLSCYRRPPMKHPKLLQNHRISTQQMRNYWKKFQLLMRSTERLLSCYRRRELKTPKLLQNHRILTQAYLSEPIEEAIETTPEDNWFDTELLSAPSPSPQVTTEPSVSTLQRSFLTRKSPPLLNSMKKILNYYLLRL